MSINKHPIVSILLNFLPYEIVYIIAYKYKAIQTPIFLNCFNYRKKKIKNYPLQADLIYYIWECRKNNNFSKNVFKCIYTLGNSNFVTNRKHIICGNYRNNYKYNKEKFGLIHYPNHLFLFPSLCNQNILIKEILKNMYIEDNSKKKEIIKNFKKYNNSHLINYYFKKI